jgi:LPXTG-site transpeptidase (sortase) family protein
MRENKVYSVRKQPASKPHKVGTKSDAPEADVKSTALHQTPVVAPTPPVAQVVPEPVEIPAEAPPPPTRAEGQQHAIALARSKIANIYGESFGKEEGSPEPGQSLEIAEGYDSEQRLQEIIDPQHLHHAQPDHQLPGEQPVFKPEKDSKADYRQQYGTFAIPGQQAANVPATESVLKEEAQPIAKHKPKPKKKKNTVKNLRKKIKQKQAAVKEEPVKVIHRFRRFVPVGILVTVVVLIMNNQLVYGQISYYVTPGSRVETPTIVEADVDNVAPPGSKVIIPKINVDVPVNYEVDSYSEEAIQAGLEDGVVHYAKTGLPGEVGNNVIFGHSTNNFWNSGKYKTAFVLLDRLEKGDTFEIHHEQKRYIYEIYGKKVIEPDDFSIITQKVTEPVVTLVTCTPPGTSWQRLVIQARQISPEPQAAAVATGNELPEGLEGDVPSDSESPLESIFGWLW